MHEMAVTQSVLNLALRAARDHGAKRILAVHIKMGEYSDVIPQILEECFTLAAKGTPAQGARLEITRLPLVIRCRDCGWEGQVPVRQPACLGCGSRNFALVGGREFYLDRLEAE